MKVVRVCEACGQNVIMKKSNDGIIPCDPWLVESDSLLDGAALLLNRYGTIKRADSGDFEGYYPHATTCAGRAKC